MFCYLFSKSSPSQKANLKGNIVDKREVKWKEVWKKRPTEIIPALLNLFKQLSLLQEMFSPLLNIQFLIFSSS